MSSLLKRRPWLLMAATVASGVAFGVALVKTLTPGVILLMAAIWAASAWVWGYTSRALEQRVWPSLDHLTRRQYAQVWNALAGTAEDAAEAACGKQSEEELRSSGVKTVHGLLELTSVRASDDVLEIGCGVGRVGLALAPQCRTWTGADISTNMIGHAAARLRAVGNARLVLLRDVGLQEFEDGSFDVVYSTDMFEHLDEIDRWRYVEEAFRVLRAGGSIYFDNFDLESEEGWTGFLNGARRYAAFERLPYMPRPSTAAELISYATRAGFNQVQAHHRPPLVIVTAVKPAQASLQSPRGMKRTGRLQAHRRKT